ncbi:VirB4 family type IV secretion system protein [Halorussus halophilus]|uniref:VirB4 family type IV secretion system protein n=1 Tax=Halorussus halophilus TaxID=2650975 RepID=UPI0013012958|nr:transfer complex protein [Halorussus halophilus]
MALFQTILAAVSGTMGSRSEREYTAGQSLVEETTQHARLVAPSSTHLESDAMRTGDCWTTTLFVLDWPKAADPGLLETITTHPSADVDLSLHASPRSTEQGIREFENAIRDLETVRRGKEKNGDPSIDLTDRRLRDHRELLGQLTNNSQTVFDVTAYITIRGETKQTVERVSKRIQTELAKRQLTTRPVDYNQADGVVSGSPIAKDTISESIPEARTPMLGCALGASFPFSTTTVLEDTGVLYGFHATTDAPVVVDRFKRPNGYNVLAAAKIGSGKSVTANLLSLREIANDPETSLILLDPLDGFRGLSDTLGGDRIVVGGQRRLNPLEIEETPASVLEATPDLDPFGQRLESVMGFFETYFGHLDSQGDGLDTNARAVLGHAVRETYARAGITRDPITHSEESPTVRDVFVVLGEMAEDARPFLETGDEVTTPTSTELEKWETRAADLRIGMRPFMGDGEFANLAGQSEVTLRESKVTYLDLQQGEADHDIALMMQLLFDAVYERAKQTQNRVILVIDEAHYLLENEGSLDWLARAYRHSRHHDLSVHLVTQEIADFFAHEKAEVLAKESSIKILQRLPGLSEEHRNLLGLNEREGTFLRQAKPGTRERGYSHALVCVEDEGHFPVKVTGLPTELQLVDPTR